MNDKVNKTKLFTEFPPVSTKDWEEKINTDLKGADYEKKLVWKTTEGISLKPYYRAEDLEKLDYLNVSPSEYPYTRGNKKDNNNWEIRQDIVESNPEEANKIAINAISRGAEAIGFNAKDVIDANDIRVLLNNIDLTKTSIHFVSATSFPVIYNLFFEEIKRQNIDVKSIRGGFNFDSISYFLLYGKYYASQDNNFIEAASLTNNTIGNIPNFKSITINGQYYHNAGATIVQELAFSLASANEYLIKLIEKGITIDHITPRIQFVFAIGSNYFMEMAKLRAARFLWAKIVEQYKPADEKSMMMDIHAVTSMWNKSVYDPN
ncbi:MAG: methylmalonyl-CoA mutase small subunit, partial [Bacteroidetes bacterium]|nr:methylmalonyl-CoA mutase small subunit [Bacteroidota bacterium]